MLLQVVAFFIPIIASLMMQLYKGEYSLNKIKDIFWTLKSKELKLNNISLHKDFLDGVGLIEITKTSI